MMISYPTKAEDMELKELIDLARRNWLILCLVTALGAGAGGALSALSTPEYEARSQIFVAVNGGDSVTDLAQGNTFSERRVSSYVSLATSSDVLERVASDPNVDRSVGQLRSSVSVSSPSQTVLIDITANDVDPETASKIAEATARALIGAVEKVEGGSEASLVKMSIVEHAVTPTSPSSPNSIRNVALGAALGMLAGATFVAFRRLLDTKVRDRESLSTVTDLAVLATLSENRQISREPLFVVNEPHSPRAEQLRHLRTQLQFTSLGGSHQTILVTSSTAGEGKSSTSIDLALIMAEAGGRVLIIDADLRRPRVADYLGMEGSVGLTTVLAGRVTTDAAIQPVGGTNGFDILASGRIPPNPTELLASDQMRELLQELSRRYETIIIDAAPVLPVADPTILAGLATGVMLVVSVDGRVRRDEVAETLNKLSAANPRILGITLNRVPATKSQTYAYSYAEPSSRRESRAQSRRRRTTHRPTPARAIRR